MNRDDLQLLLTEHTDAWNSHDIERLSAFAAVVTRWPNVGCVLLLSAIGHDWRLPLSDRSAA